MAAKPRSARTLLALAALCILALVAAFAPAYWRAAETLDALQRSDETELAARVDFTALRADVQADLSRALDAHYAAAGADSTTQSLAAMIVRPFLNAVVDQAASPAGFAIMAREALGSDYAAKDFGALLGYVSARASWQGPSQLALRVGEKDDAPTTLLFARRGLDWKLVGVDFPPSALQLPE